MRNLILQQFTSIDGLASDSQGGTGFIADYAKRRDQSFEREGMEFMDSIDTMILGRKTYELFSQYWPSASGEDAEFGKKLNNLDKYVVSSTLVEAPWGRWPAATVISSEPAKEIASQKESDGKDMVIWGSLSLATTLMTEGLIDEVQLRVVPVALGTGRQLFTSDLGQVGLKLRDITAHDEGIVVSRYAVVQ